MVEPAIAPAFRFWDLFFLPCSVTRILSANRRSQLPFALEPHQQQMRSRLRPECYDFDMRRNVRGLRDLSTLRWRQQFLERRAGGRLHKLRWSAGTCTLRLIGRPLRSRTELSCRFTRATARPVWRNLTEIPRRWWGAHHYILADARNYSAFSAARAKDRDNSRACPGVTWR